jgi:hypothetical protein
MERDDDANGDVPGVKPSQSNDDDRGDPDPVLSLRTGPCTGIAKGCDEPKLPLVETGSVGSFGEISVDGDGAPLAARARGESVSGALVFDGGGDLERGDLKCLDNADKTDLLDRMPTLVRALVADVPSSCCGVAGADIEYGPDGDATAGDAGDDSSTAVAATVVGVIIGGASDADSAPERVRVVRSIEPVSAAALTAAFAEPDDELPDDEWSWW